MIDIFKLNTDRFYKNSKVKLFVYEDQFNRGTLLYDIDMIYGVRFGTIDWLFRDLDKNLHEYIEPIAENETHVYELSGFYWNSPEYTDEGTIYGYYEYDVALKEIICHPTIKPAVREYNPCDIQPDPDCPF